MTEIHPHIPILVHEVVEHLITNPGGIYLDGTVGFGGHASQIMAKLSSGGLLIGMDCDKEALTYTSQRLSALTDKKFKLYHNNFRHYPEIFSELNITKIDGMLLDLGISSYELDTPERGFSYSSDGPLDMRFNNESGLSAEEYLNETPEKNLADTIRTLGEERFARKIASSIVKYSRRGEMKTTYQLRDAVLSVVRGKFRLKSVARVFQAIRIKINGELESLTAALDSCEKFLTPGGRLAVISFHSLEDRIVKQYIQRKSVSCICPKEIPICVCGQVATFRKVNRRAILPSQKEIDINPRAHSAKMRVAERI